MILVCNPDQLPFATLVVSRRPPRPEMMLVAKATFRLAADGALERLPLGEATVTGDTFDPKDVDATGEVLAPSDFAHAKLKPEVIVRASCHTPGRTPLKECPVSISVGRWKKVLRVVGPRVWIDDALGGAAAPPQPFTTMPITWANAWGGPAVAANPVGIGGPGSPELPRVELPHEPVTKRGSGFQPAGFGPVSPLWPVRLAKMGRAYDDTWKATRAPFVAEDFDWSYHQSAPPDQWLSSLRGDEALAFENLHPEASLLATRLPGQRVVAHARRKGGPVVPVAMTLDTLFVDLEASTVSLTWRGHLAVATMDLSDVHSVHLALADLEGKPRSVADVARDLEAFEADPAGLGAVKQEIEARFAAIEPSLPAAPALPPGASSPKADPVTAKLDGLFSDESVVRRHVRAQMQAALEGPDGAKIAEQLARIDAPAEESPEPPVPRGSPGVAPSTGLRRRMRPVAEKIAVLRRKPDTPAIALERAELAEAQLRDPEFARADPEYSYPEPLSNDPPGPGADLVDRDFTGMSLLHADLRGAKLDGAVFTRADLRGANLEGASLRGATLFHTRLDGANLTGADLSRANLARVHAREARFDRTRIEETFFQDADLAKASFVGARGSWPVFERARLFKADLASLEVDHADFGEAVLDAASFREAKLATSLFERSQAAGTDFESADLSRCVFRGAVMTGARLVRTKASRACFDAADLSKADLSLATMRHTHLTEAILEGAEVYGADLREARLYRADLSDAVFERANLFGADLVATRLDRTSFVSASLYEAKLLEAAGEGADFRNANLENCRHSAARPIEVDG